MKRAVKYFLLKLVMVLAIMPVTLKASGAITETWSWSGVKVRVDGVVTDIAIPSQSRTSQLFLPIAPVLRALNLPEDYIQFML